ncbi:hypothetical protein GCM10010885_20000 [Alicyclobacillus cellulosilyticus]|uniref:Alpha-L-arabinofuranosidase n=1 Tax=Alicyclobacillus cellulosilyticus TaxID=1003997 RepID=A0A917NND9_9BACL|nr:cellulose-binding protein [Alicyclobacillus cellulosilyticus]GGJ10779.1 hypothetical protein GCM10010885_20000 [Alicyclobacillus cellulosilyticus]
MRSPRPASLAATIALTTLCTAAPAVTAQAGRADLTGQTGTRVAVITVNAAAPVATVPNTAFGINTAVWDGHLMDPIVPARIQKTGATVLRYPGGSTSDVYHWQTNQVENGWAWPQDKFDNFMKVVRAVKGQAILTVNAGTGTAEEAAAWVKYANVTRRYGVKFWEIGNELYGNWEAGNFAGKPADYAKRAVTFIRAMKAVDPSIRIGVDLVAPGTGDDAWNASVLSAMKDLGTLPDFGIVHWYPQQPGGESDPGLLQSTNQIATMMDTLKQQLQPYGHIPVFVTETNSVSYNPGKQSTSLVNALFLADDLLDWIQAGAVNVDWWDLHNGPVTPPDANVSSSLYGNTRFGDYGLLANGESKGNITEPPANTPFPAYYGFQMVAPFAVAGAKLVGAGSSTETLAAHAAQLPNGDLVVMIINRDPAQTYHVQLQIEGASVKARATKLWYGMHTNAPVQQPVANVQQGLDVPPYSITDLVLHTQPTTVPGKVQLADRTEVRYPSIRPGYTQQMLTTLSCRQGQVRNATVALELYDASGRMAAQKTVRGVSLQAGQTTQPLSLTWKVPDIQGTYTVQAFVFGQDGTMWYRNAHAGKFTVTKPDPPVVTAKVSLSAATVKVGTPVTITTRYTETAPTGYLTNGLLVQYVFTGDGKFVAQSAPSANLAPGQTITETWTWTPEQPGIYKFPQGVFTSNWKLLQWIDQAAPTLTVTE